MKKRLLTIIVTLIALVCLISLVPSAQTAQASAQAGTFRAGYCKIRIDPSVKGITGLPMSGYGKTTARLSEGTMDDTGDGAVTTADGLFATCVVVTDQYDNTLLYMGVDIINCGSWSNVAKRQVLTSLQDAGYDIEYNNIIFSASHTHNGPDLTYGLSFTEEELAADSIAQKVKTYRDWVLDQLCAASLSAMQDRVEVTMTKGSVDASNALGALYPSSTTNQRRMNYVRHYRNSDGTFGGSNFGVVKTTSSSTTMVSEPVDTMYLVQFTPKSGSKDPIVLVNWNAHVTINSTTGNPYGVANHYKVSSDYVNKLRIDLLSGGYRAAFVQGAAGNTTPTTNVTSLKNPDVLGSDGYPRAYLYGAKLAEVALYGLKNNMSSALDTSSIRTMSKSFSFNTNAPTAEEAALVNAMLDESVVVPEGFDTLIAYLTYNSTNWAKRTEYYTQFPYLKMINSRYQLSNANARMVWLDYPESTITVGAIRIGTQLSFVVSPCELSDRYSLTATIGNFTDNDWNDLRDSTYGMPLIIGYANNAMGYMPNYLAYTYNEGSTSYAPGSYESQSARYAQGTGEQMIVFYNEMLDELNTTVSRFQCECGGKATNGANGHTCVQKEFFAWSKTDSLPSGGNYYLTTNVTLTEQTEISNTLRLDLNGHNITYKVAADNTASTRVFSISNVGHLIITDSTATAGKITRDLSSKTTAEQQAITNYGLLILVNESCIGGATVYNGTLDATGQYAGGGGVVAILGHDGFFKMYGGTLKGGISNQGGIMYLRGHAEFYGGLVTGGVTKEASGHCGGISVQNYKDISGKVTIGGTAQIQGNKKSNGTATNIRFANLSDMADNFTVSGTFTGKVGVFVNSRSNGMDVGNSDNASFTASNLALDYHTDYPFLVSGSDLILGTVRNQCECGGKVSSGINGHTCQKIDFLPWAKTSSLPTSGNYYLVNDVTLTTQMSLADTLRLDLNGHTITHKIAVKQGTLAENGSSHNTRVIYLFGAANLSVTDSTTTPGKITRDLTLLTDAQKNAITNWGLIIAMNADSTGTFTLYNGTLDATDMISGGGACVANMGTSANRGTFKMYGGTLKGGISNGGSCIYSSGSVELYGGTVTGGKATGSVGAVNITTSGRLTLGGSATVNGNFASDGTTPSNINVPSNRFTVIGTYSGTAGLNANLADNAVVGTSNNAVITGKIKGDKNTNNAFVYVSGTNLVVAGDRTYCECGKTLSGKTAHGHTCKDITWSPWTSTTSLPGSGNYYLTDDVVITAQKNISGDLKIDLNGHSITHKVASGATNTRVFNIAANGSLVITDSTATPGSVSRDLSLLTEDGKNAITNYGLLVLIGNVQNAGNFTLYNGIMDASGTLTCGGAITNLNTYGAKVVIYGGTLYGATSRTYNGDGGYAGCIYSWGPVEVHGGTITGGKAALSGGGIYLSKATSSLLLTGNPVITGNYKLDGTTADNVYSSYSVSKITVQGNFTGTVGFSPVKAPANGNIVATSSSANISGATLWIDNNPRYGITVSGSSLVMTVKHAVETNNNGTLTYHESLQDAIDAYPGGDAVLKLLADNTETVTFDKATNLDLAGFDLSDQVTVAVSLKIMDSETADYTIENGNGYGVIPSTLANVEAMDGYLMITEGTETSFHRLNLDTIGLSLRPDSTGVYYQSQFGGDEVIKRNIVAYGTALGAGKAPDFADKTYTRFTDLTSWLVGMNSSGYSNNLKNGTLLEGILKETNSYSVNRRNALIKVYSQAYVELPDGTRILGDAVSFSLKEIMEGTDGLTGVDQSWNDLSDAQKSKIMTMYETFEKNFASWALPNIRQGIVDREDDGVLKILMIGHSLGVDSTYFFPQVYKAETGQDIVVGTLYHSGCRLGQHADYLTNKKTEYAYLEYDTSKDTAWRIWETEEGANGFVTHFANQAHDSYIGAGATSSGNPNKYGVTMDFGIEQHDWDIVVMQAGVFEAANLKDASYTLNIAGDIATIQNHVKDKDVNKYTTPKFAWNVTWSAPEDKTLTGTSSYNTLLANHFNDSSVEMYESIISTLNNIVPTARFDYIFPSGTAMENAKTVMTDKQVHRDMIHATEFGRLMVAYTWFCELTDTHISDCKITSIGSELRQSTADRNNKLVYQLTDEERRILRDCVQNAIEKPHQLTQISEADDVLKILVVGHSTGMDSAYLLPAVFKAAGQDVIIGDLYHSGCRLSMHANYLTNNSAEYAYLEYNTKTDTSWRIWETAEASNGFVKHTPNQAHDIYIGAMAASKGNPNKYGVTLQFALQQQDWDIVVLMSGGFESTNTTGSGAVLDITDVALLRQYILNNDLNKTTVPEFAWKMVWAYPEDESLAGTSTNRENMLNNFGSAEGMYQRIVEVAETIFLKDYNYAYLLPNGTTMQNARQHLEETDLFRDYAHATDFGRLMIAYSWYCAFTGNDIEDLTIASIPNALRYSTADRNTGNDYTLTAAQKTILVNCVKNALANPFEVTK